MIGLTTIIPGLTRCIVDRVGTMMMSATGAADTTSAVIPIRAKPGKTSEMFATRARMSKQIGSS